MTAEHIEVFALHQEFLERMKAESSLKEIIS
jgi:hypothetical protein